MAMEQALAIDHRSEMNRADPSSNTSLARLRVAHWSEPIDMQDQDQAFETLERGEVLWLPQLPFRLEPAERRLLDPGLAVRAKNISLTRGAEEVRGIEASTDEKQLLHGMMKRYSDSTIRLLEQLLPDYAAAAKPGRTSFRPAEIEGRSTSWRKDDTRLHVDSFPSSPTAGWRFSVSVRRFVSVP